MHTTRPQTTRLSRRRFLTTAAAGAVATAALPGVVTSAKAQGKKELVFVGCVTIPMLLTYSTKAYAQGRAPLSWPDFWDAKKFPGPRGYYNAPTYSLEFALIADGAPKDKLYPLDVPRALKSLDRIKPDVK